MIDLLAPIGIIILAYLPRLWRHAIKTYESDLASPGRVSTSALDESDPLNGGGKL
jgi:hypothetical protein